MKRKEELISWIRAIIDSFTAMSPKNRREYLIAANKMYELELKVSELANSEASCEDELEIELIELEEILEKVNSIMRNITHKEVTQKEEESD